MVCSMAGKHTARLSCSLLYDPNDTLYDTTGNMLLVFTEMK